MKISHKILAGYTGILLLASFAGSVVIIKSFDIERSVNRITLSDIKEVEGATETTYLIQRTMNYLREIPLEFIEGHEGEEEEAKKIVRESLSEIERQIVLWKEGLQAGLSFQEKEDGNLEDFHLFKTKIKMFIALVNEVITLSNKKDFDAVAAFFDLELEPLLGEIHALGERLEENARNELFNNANHINTEITHSRMIGIVTIVTVFLIAAMIGQIISSSIKRSIKELEKAAEEVGKGNLDFKVNTGTGDEIGRFADAFNGMSEKLRYATDDLTSANVRLEKEVTEHKRAVKMLEEANEKLNISQDSALNIMEDMQLEVAEREKAEITLKKSAFQLAEAQRIAHIGNWEWDIVGDRLYWSDEIYRIFGLEPHEFDVTHEAFLNAVHPDDRDFVKQSVDEALSSKIPYNIDHRIILSDGTERIVHQKAEISSDSKGHVVHMTGTVQDITERKRTEEKLSVFNMFAEASGQGFAMATLDRKITYVNPTLCRMIDESRALDCYSKEIRDYYPGNVQKRFEEKILPIVMEKGQWTGELELKAASGEIIPTIENIFLIRDAYGKPAYLANVITDIKKQKVAEEELAIIKAQLEHLLTSSPVIIYSWWYEDDNFAPSYISANLKRLFGYQPEDIIYSQIWWSENIHPDDRKRIFQHFPKDLFEKNYHIHEYRFKHNDGTYRWVRDEMNLVHSDNNHVMEIVGSWTDITEQKRLENELNNHHKAVEKSNQAWVDTFDSIAEPLFLHDAEYRIVKANMAYQKLSGVPFNEIIGRPYYEVFPKMDGPIDICKRAMETEEGDLEMEITTGDIEKTYKVREFTRFAANGKHELSIHVMEDVTDFKRTQGMLVQTSKLASIGELAANVAHEINNPMTAVLGYTSLILEEIEKDSPFYEDLKTVEKESHRITNIIRNLLDFSRQRKVDRKEAKIEDVVKESISLVASMARTSDVSIEYDFHDNLPLIEVDANQMKQVFLNLANNAIQAMEGGGKLIVSGKIYGDANERGDLFMGVKFKDTGCGVSKAFKSRIFDPFVSSKGEEGTGLGLSVSYGIVKNHGGELVVESEEGKGSEFTVLLPVNKQHDEHLGFKEVTGKKPVVAT